MTMKKFGHLREDWKLVALALAFAAIILGCYGWGILRGAASFEKAFGVQGSPKPPAGFQLEEAKKILGERGGAD
ncbi:MAG: hypothetical protein A2946_01330 [Candidatus Liptonbacteria bacterium RIFCSPLOWO2_01_FULL_53_13]|uniref:Uncharacterized protein n=1 Tax=Candidatus Liptonbacteria bacterium RIFCSPLOWO2_01_FULL_53_13 TaxID=1798651 RepID=A0A1G2CLU3_9BACT|nr:MAG: hypothetical protein A2946_01330 [Candidatus Liptonbacteria bacterium RIFCSPLOWO2_01_FULL_53_13]